MTVLGTTPVRVALDGRLLHVGDDTIALGDEPLDVTLERSLLEARLC